MTYPIIENKLNDYCFEPNDLCPLCVFNDELRHLYSVHLLLATFNLTEMLLTVLHVKKITVENEPNKLAKLIILHTPNS